MSCGLHFQGQIYLDLAVPSVRLTSFILLLSELVPMDPNRYQATWKSAGKRCENGLRTQKQNPLGKAQRSESNFLWRKTNLRWHDPSFGRLSTRPETWFAPAQDQRFRNGSTFHWWNVELEETGAKSRFPKEFLEHWTHLSGCASRLQVHTEHLWWASVKTCRSRINMTSCIGWVMNFISSPLKIKALNFSLNEKCL